MAKLIGCRVVVVMTNGKEICGTLMAFDGARDLVLGDAERRWMSKNRRPVLEQLGPLVLLKGCTVDSIMVKRPASATVVRRGPVGSKEVSLRGTSGLSKGLRGL